MEVRSITRAGAFAALITVVTVAFRFVQPFLVPFSLQPVMVMLAGCLLTPAEAALALTVYLLLGLMGFPVFASPPFGGLAYVFKPSFGFLLGFLPASWLMSLYLSRGRYTVGRLLIACGMGMVVYYAIGLPYLYLVLKFYLHQSAGLWQVLKIGLLPFIGLDVLKAVLAAWLASRLRPILMPGEELV